MGRKGNRYIEVIKRVDPSNGGQNCVYIQQNKLDKKKKKIRAWSEGIFSISDFPLKLVDFRAIRAAREVRLFSFIQWCQNFYLIIFLYFFCGPPSFSMSLNFLRRVLVSEISKSM